MSVWPAGHTKNDDSSYTIAGKEILFFSLYKENERSILHTGVLAHHHRHYKINSSIRGDIDAFSLEKNIEL
jgi:hypothetical protein